MYNAQCCTVYRTAVQYNIYLRNKSFMLLSPTITYLTWLSSDIAIVIVRELMLSLLKAQFYNHQSMLPSLFDIHTTHSLPCKYYLHSYALYPNHHSKFHHSTLYNQSLTQTPVDMCCCYTDGRQR